MTRNLSNILLPLAFGVLGAVVGNVALAPASLHADGNPATDGVPRYFAYTGTLELDGSPVSVDQMPMRFTIWRGSTAVLTECWVAAAAPGCSATTSAVPVYGGRFSVGLGRWSAAAVVESIFANADGLELGIELGVPGDGGALEWVPLAGRQAFTPVPWAFWSSNATDLAVSGADSDGATGPLSIYSGSERLTMDGNEIDSNVALRINRNTAQAVEMGGSLSVEGASTLIGTVNSGRTTTIGGNTNVNGALSVSGATTLSSGFVASANSDVNGALEVNSLFSNSTIESFGAMRSNGLMTAAAGLLVNGANAESATTAAFRIASAGGDVLVADGNSIDVINGNLFLNNLGNRPVVLPVIRAQVSEFNDNAGPEAYQLVTTGVNAMPYTCNETNRGGLIVANLEDQNQDGLCACLRVDGAYEWWCFNP